MKRSSVTCKGIVCKLSNIHYIHTRTKSIASNSSKSSSQNQCRTRNKEGENRRIFHADSESIHMTTSLTWGENASLPSITVSEELKLNWSRDQQFYHETPPPQTSSLGFTFGSIWDRIFLLLGESVQVMSKG